MRILCIVIALLLSGCVPGYYKVQQDNIVYGKQIAYGAIMNCNANGVHPPPNVFYRSYDVLMADHDQRAVVEMWTEAELQERRRVTPMGGLILVGTKGNTIDMAAQDNWRIVVEADGQRIADRTGSRTTSSVPVWTGFIWESSITASINTKPSGPMTAYIIRLIPQGRMECVITPNPIVL
jgi:hypothetical protein